MYLVYLHLLFPVPTNPPLNFFVQAPMSRLLHFTWQPVPLEYRNGIILGHVINVTSQYDTFTLLYSGPENTTHVAAMFKPYTVYEATIAAFTQVGVGPFSPMVSVMTPQDGELTHVCL